MLHLYPNLVSSYIIKSVHMASDMLFPSLFCLHKMLLTSLPDDL